VNKKRKSEVSRKEKLELKIKKDNQRLNGKRQDKDSSIAFE